MISDNAHRQAGVYTLHEGDTTNPDDAQDEPLAEAGNPRALIQLAKPAWRRNPEKHYFICNDAGKVVGEVGKDNDGNIVVWTR